MQITFEGAATFEAKRKAETWCRARGISFGSSCAASPQGLLFGDWLIAKWRNLTDREIKELHGRITGDGREGPVTVYIKPNYEHLLPGPAPSGSSSTQSDGKVPASD